MFRHLLFRLNLSDGTPDFVEKDTYPRQVLLLAHCQSSFLRKAHLNHGPPLTDEMSDTLRNIENRTEVRITLTMNRGVGLHDALPSTRSKDERADGAA